MKWNALKKIDNAPSQGRMFLYLRSGVRFEVYSSLSNVQEIIGNQEILELHLFDEHKEYRALASESPRFPDGCIEWISDFTVKDCFRDQVVIDDSGEPMTIVNHISYNDTGMANIDDYRLVMGKR